MSIYNQVYLLELSFTKYNRKHTHTNMLSFNKIKVYYCFIKTLLEIQMAIFLFCRPYQVTSTLRFISGVKEAAAAPAIMFTF